MRIAYLDCSTGISGDMTLAALVDAGVNADQIIAGIDSLGLPGVKLSFSSTMKGGFHATSVKIEHPEQHAHRHLSDIVKILKQSDQLTPKQYEMSLALFSAIAGAEAKVHGSTIDKVHFHEVGAIDSIVDIVGVAIGFDLLEIEQIFSSPIPTGYGQIKIDHGICTVPAPGTAELLKGIPLADIPIQAELTTPTGAAIISTLVDRFSMLPPMTIEEIGYGAGTKNFPERANLLRLFVGELVTNSNTDYVTLLETNLDDVSGEVIGYTKQKLLAAGALDVYTSAIQMKKDRPAVMLSVICKPESADKLESILFQETETLGIRRHQLQRSIRSRQQQSVKTAWGEVDGKLSLAPNQSTIFTPEYESCAQLAERHQVSLRTIYRAAEAAFQFDGKSAATIDTAANVPH
ncbi:MAG: nickel pincer cofactor biosynthesis protein LarC, partial [Planctomycetaceae bacterium]|nr:nickel pincer cofactor biosynthesis protein LarC [Planctomycetaceae bacterium]